MASRSTACGVATPAYATSSVISTPRDTGTGRATTMLFWPRTRTARSRPYSRADTEVSSSESASLSVSVLTDGATTSSRRRVRPSSHRRAGSNDESMSYDSTLKSASSSSL